MTSGTEDDTFNALRRPGFEEMLEIHNAWQRREGFVENRSLRIPFMEKHNWTWLEFVLEANKRGRGDAIL